MPWSKRVKGKFRTRSVGLLQEGRKNTGGANAGVRDARGLTEAVKTLVHIQKRAAIDAERQRVDAVNDRLKSLLPTGGPR